MEEKKERIRISDRFLTVDEAKINTIKTQMIDFDNPTKDMICGMPGFTR